MIYTNPAVNMARLDSIIEEWNTTLSGPTALAYRGSLNLLRRSIGDDRVLSTTSDELRSFLESVRADSMRRRAVSAIHSFYAFAEERKYLRKDPSQRLYVKRLKRPTFESVVSRCRVSKERRHKLVWSDYLSSLGFPKSSKAKAFSRLSSLDRCALLSRFVGQVRACQSEATLRSLLKSPIAPRWVK